MTITALKRKPIIGKDLKTGRIVRFHSAADAGRNGYSRDGIAHALIGNQDTSSGMVWEFA